MADEFRARQNNNRTAKNGELYIYGNTVRQARVERRHSIETIEEHQREYNQRRRKDKEYVSSMNMGYVFFLAVAAVIVFAAMGHFLILSSQVSKNQEAVASMKENTISLKADNDDYERRIERSINIDEVRRIAMEELGMVYPSSGQIVKYNYEESDYVRQYSEVPQE